MIPRSLYFDIRGYIADSVVNRSVEFVRAGAYGKLVIQDDTVIIPLGQSYELIGADSNSMTMVKSSSPVDIVVTTPEGVLRLPAQKLMILNTNITSLVIENLQVGASGYSGVGYSGYSGYSGIPPNTIEAQVHILHT
jgi:hypothetical protein